MDTQLGRRARAKAANRQAIIDAARRVFARLGYGAATIRDIIRETDLASGTFYNYFKSKEEVFEAIADDSARRFRLRLNYVRSNSLSFPDYVRSAYAAYFNFLAEENDEAIREGTPHLALIGVRTDTPEMSAIAEEIKQDLSQILRQSGRDDLDVPYLAAAAIGIARELGDYMLRRRPIDPHAAAEFAANIMKDTVNRL